MHSTAQEVFKQFASQNNNVLIKAFWYGKILQHDSSNLKEEQQLFKITLQEWTSTLSPIVARNILYKSGHSIQFSSFVDFLTPDQGLLDWSKFQKTFLISSFPESGSFHLKLTMKNK
jgi:hypothetical protein